MVILFDFLREQGITSQNVTEIIHKWDKKRLKKFITEINQKIPIDNRSADSIFDFFANTVLSGGPHPCSSLSCRLKNVDVLSRLSVLYADRVLITNPFEEFTYYKTFNDSVKEDISNSISILYHIKPLLDAQIITIGKSNGHVCPNCFEEIIISRNTNLSLRVSDIRKLLYKEYLSNCKFSLEKENDYFYANIQGSEELLDHPISIFYSDVSEAILKRFNSKSEIQLIKKHIKELEILECITGPIIDDLVMQDYYSNIYNANFLTNRNIDIKLMSIVNKNSDNELNKNVYDALSHTVPFVISSNLDNLVNMRLDEGESFKVYRDSLNSLIHRSRQIESRYLQQAFNDEILPELNKIDLTIKNNKKRFSAKISRDLLVGGCFVGLGLFSGILPANIGEIIAALGGFKYVTNISDSVAQLIDKSDEARSNKYFFLWKAKQIQNKII